MVADSSMPLGHQHHCNSGAGGSDQGQNVSVSNICTTSWCCAGVACSSFDSFASMHLFFVAFGPRVVSVYSSHYAGAGVACSLLDLFAIRAGVAHSSFDLFVFVQVLARSLLYLVLG